MIYFSKILQKQNKFDLIISTSQPASKPIGQPSSSSAFKRVFHGFGQQEGQDQGRKLGQNQGNPDSKLAISSQRGCFLPPFFIKGFVTGHCKPFTHIVL